jgi:GNAT superfamily N-acetyltransferase
MKKDLYPKSQDIAIRHMRAEDIEQLVAQFCFPWSSIEATRKLWQNYYKEHQENIRTVGIVEKGGRIAGYGSLLRRSEYPRFSDIPEINAIWIDEDYRRLGVGKKLIAYLEEMARKEGYKQIGIGVGLYQDYGPAQKLYFQLGYVPDGNGVTYKCQPVKPGEKYPVDDDLILWMVKPL